MISSRDSSSGSDSDSEDGDSDSSGGSSLSGGEIAGIAIGAVSGVVLIAGLLICLFLRRKRRSKQRAYEVTNISTHPAMTTVGGPAQNGNMPYSSADVSGWSQTESPPRAVAAASGTTATSSTPELDGRATQKAPNTELDGREIPYGKTPVALNPGVYELAGSKPVGGANFHGAARGRGDLTPATEEETSPQDSARVSDESPPSPYVSTIGTTWGERPVSEMVSPIHPHYSQRP